MEITATTQNNVAILALSGRLDGLTSPALEQRVDALLQGGTRRLVFDCAALSYASSAGLRVFLGSAKKFRSAGGSAVFAALAPAVHEVFELSGFIGVLEVYASAEAAVVKLA
ncbi:MAG: STAS domain-containing protein [Verrucomicrobiota bacterium]